MNFTIIFFPFHIHFSYSFLGVLSLIGLTKVTLKLKKLIHLSIHLVWYLVAYPNFHTFDRLSGTHNESKLAFFASCNKSALKFTMSKLIWNCYDFTRVFWFYLILIIELRKIAKWNPFKNQDSTSSSKNQLKNNKNFPSLSYLLLLHLGVLS